MFPPLLRRYTRIAICVGWWATTLMLGASPKPRFEIPHGAQPQLAVAKDGRVWLTYADSGYVFTAYSRDGGMTFSEPRKVGNVPHLMVGMRRGPRIAALKDRVTVTLIGDELMAFLSEDGGITWTDPVTINDVPASAREGLHDLAIGPSGELFVTWLDLRNGSMELWSAQSTNGGRSWQTDQQLYRSPDKSICTCCQPSALFDSDGNLAVMWRNAIAGSRDMWLMTRMNGAVAFSSPRKLGEGSWQIEGCPMDGGRIVALGDGKFATVWQRSGEAFFCPPNGAEVKIGWGKQPTAAIWNGEPVFIWQQTNDVVLASLHGARAPTRVAEEARFPVLVKVNDRDDAVLAYEYGPPKEPNVAVERIQIRGAIRQ